MSAALEVLALVGILSAYVGGIGGGVVLVARWLGVEVEW